MAERQADTMAACLLMPRCIVENTVYLYSYFAATKNIIFLIFSLPLAIYISFWYIIHNANIKGMFL